MHSCRVTKQQPRKHPARFLPPPTTCHMTDIVYRRYAGESDLPQIMALVQSELSEPYVIYTFRYFLHQWPHLSYLAHSSDPEISEPVGVVVCKQGMHRDRANRGYIAMLSVRKEWRNRGIARTLVRAAIETMKEDGADEVVLDTEYDNHAALSLYESLGFIREKRLYRFYLNGKDAFRLVLVLPHSESSDDSTNTSDITVSSRSSRSRRRPLHRAIQVSPYSDEESS